MFHEYSLTWCVHCDSAQSCHKLRQPSTNERYSFVQNSMGIYTIQTTLYLWTDLL